MAERILNLKIRRNVSSQLYAPVAVPRNSNLQIPLRWAPEAALMFWRIEKSYNAGNRRADRPARGVVTASAQLSCSYFNFTFTFTSSFTFTSPTSLLFVLLYRLLLGKHYQQTGENCTMRSFAGYGAHAADNRNAYRLGGGGELRKETTCKC